MRGDARWSPSAAAGACAVFGEQITVVDLWQQRCGDWGLGFGVSGLGFEV